jgi:hypothetical protein
LPGPGKGEWKRSDFKKQWGIYQAVYDKQYSFPVPVGTRQLTLENTEGDWLNFSDISLSPFTGSMKQATILQADPGSWGVKQEPIRLAKEGVVERSKADVRFDEHWLRSTCYAAWNNFEDNGGTVMVGECGVYNKTPHAVTLKFLKDLFAVFKNRGWGWALWNFRGAFGILDSGRDDVTYEDWQGHKLDRRMLELLRRY